MVFNQTDLCATTLISMNATGPPDAGDGGPDHPGAYRMIAPRLQLSGITKRYPGVVANSEVALTVLPGRDARRAG